MQNNGVLANHKQDWEDLAHGDPLWAISSHADKKGNQWNSAEFFATGVREISAILSKAQSLALPVHRTRALDFGCGVGRLTRALNTAFTQAVGVDISSQMIAQAKTLNPSCVFVELKDFDFHGSSFDLIYTSHVLQHQPSPQIAREYITRMLQMLAPGGLLVFQLPHHVPLMNRLQPRRRLYSLLRSLGVPAERLLSNGLQPIRMISVKQAQVVDIVEAAGAKVLLTQTDTPYSNLYFCSFTTEAS